MTNVEVACAPKTSAVWSAIEAHKAAWAVLQALGDNIDDARLGAATEAESAAMMGLANAPSSASELLVTLRYITGFKLKTEDAPTEGDGYGALAIAVRSYFGEPGLSLSRAKS